MGCIQKDLPPGSLWQSVVKGLAESDVASFTRCFMPFWTHLYFQAPWNLAAMSSKCNYAVSEKVLLFVCFKHCLIISLSATYSCILRNGEQSLPILLLHAALHLAGLLCSPSVFSYFSWKVLVPTFFFLKVKVIPYPFCCLSNSRVSFLKQCPSACSEGVGTQWLRK